MSFIYFDCFSGAAGDMIIGARDVLVTPITMEKTVPDTCFQSCAGQIKRIN